MSYVNGFKHSKAAIDRADQQRSLDIQCDKEGLENHQTNWLCFIKAALLGFWIRSILLRFNCLSTATEHFTLLSPWSRLDATGCDTEQRCSPQLLRPGCQADDICQEGGLSAAGSTFSEREDEIYHDIWSACGARALRLLMSQPLAFLPASSYSRPHRDTNTMSV